MIIKVLALSLEDCDFLERFFAKNAGKIPGKDMEIATNILADIGKIKETLQAYQEQCRETGN